MIPEAVAQSVGALFTFRPSIMRSAPVCLAAVYFDLSKRVVAIATHLETGEWAFLDLRYSAPVLCDFPPQIIGADYVFAEIREPSKRWRLRMPTRVGLVKYMIGMTGLLPLTGRGLYRELTK